MYDCINFDFPERRMPVMILISGVWFNADYPIQILCSCYCLHIITRFQKINFFTFLKLHDNPIISI